MRRLLGLLILAILAIGLAMSSPQAARNIGADATPTEGMELVVFEVDGCVYCSVFRRDVLPSYQLSTQAKDVPIRFVDLNHPDADRIGLDGDISMVPTVVLLKANREIGRIPGYTGPDNFFQLVKHLISRAG